MEPQAEYKTPAEQAEQILDHMFGQDNILPVLAGITLAMEHPEWARALYQLVNDETGWESNEKEETLKIIQNLVDLNPISI